MHHDGAKGASDEAREQEEAALLARYGRMIARRGLTAPAILFLESVRPMGFIASQAMVFFGPMVGLVSFRRDYDAITRLLEDREGVERLICAIEAADRSDTAAR